MWRGAAPPLAVTETPKIFLSNYQQLATRTSQSITKAHAIIKPGEKTPVRPLRIGVFYETSKTKV
jgi:hypothetical protein